MDFSKIKNIILKLLKGYAIYFLVMVTVTTFASKYYMTELVEETEKTEIEIYDPLLILNKLGFVSSNAEIREYIKQKVRHSEKVLSYNENKLDNDYIKYLEIKKLSNFTEFPQVGKCKNLEQTIHIKYLLNKNYIADFKKYTKLIKPEFGSECEEYFKRSIFKEISSKI